jgi:probable FeS assembly SUF system protein SufT
MRRGSEQVALERPVDVERIPDGEPMTLAAGTPVMITQALGSSFTLWADGQLVRLRGDDADAIGEEPPVSIEIPDTVGPEDVEALAWQAMRTCYDPEIPVDIVELGLVYGCDISTRDDGSLLVQIRMTLTAPGCGMGSILATEVSEKVGALPHVGRVEVELVFDPPWDRSMMSEAAALTLGL